MAAPILVRAYSVTTGQGPHPSSARGVTNAREQTLPPISSYAFADMLRIADSPDFQHAIDGIAEICAKNRMSLADEYASHLPPLGEITATGSMSITPHVLRPRKRRALTSVPEASSSGSEGSRRSKKKSAIFNFRRAPKADGNALRQIQIGSMGRTLSVSSTTALTTRLEWPPDDQISDGVSTTARPTPPQRTSSEAALSSQRLLGAQPTPNSG